jgi:hypothetical protein
MGVGCCERSESGGAFAMPCPLQQETLAPAMQLLSLSSPPPLPLQAPARITNNPPPPLLPPYLPTPSLIPQVRAFPPVPLRLSSDSGGGRQLRVAYVPQLSFRHHNRIPVVNVTCIGTSVQPVSRATPPLRALCSVYSRCMTPAESLLYALHAPATTALASDHSSRKAAGSGCSLRSMICTAGAHHSHSVLL